MFVFRNSAFLVCLLACGVAVLAIAYHSHSTTEVDSCVLSEWQMGKIFGGKRGDDCEVREGVEGCGGTVSIFIQDPIAMNWYPPAPYPGEDPADYKERCEAVAPECFTAGEIKWFRGESAEGPSAVIVDDNIYCVENRQYTRTIIANARANNPSMSKCIKTNTNWYCVLCKREVSTWEEAPKTKYRCPDGE